MRLAPLNVEVWSKNPYGDDVFDTSVGPNGKTYQLNFIDLMNLIRSRNGYEQRRLEYRR